MMLKEIAKIRTGLVLSRKKASSYDETKIHYKLITLKAFSEKTTLISKYFDDFIANVPIDDNYMSQEGNIIVRLRYPNIAAYIDKKAASMIVPSLVSIIKVTDNININNEFLAFYLNSLSIKKILQKALKGTTIPMIKSEDLEELTINLPSLQIQKSVVNFFKLSYKEEELLKELKMEKEKFTKNILENIIYHSKGYQ